MADDEDTGLTAGSDIPPWLQPVPEGEDEAAEVSRRRKLIFTAGGAVVVIGLFVSVILFLYDGSSTGAPRHVKAPTTVLKERPADVGGMRVAHQDKKVFDRVDGSNARSEVQLGERPEEPLATLPEDPVEETPAVDAIAEMIEQTTGAVKQEVAKPVAKKVVVVKPVTNKPEPSTISEKKADPVKKAAASTEKVYKVQLGAYRTEAAAGRAWKTVKGKFSAQFKGKLSSYEAVKSGDRTLYRLRVGPLKTRVEADQVCLALRAGQQACIVVNP